MYRVYLQSKICTWFIHPVHCASTGLERQARVSTPLCYGMLWYTLLVHLGCVLHIVLWWAMHSTFLRAVLQELRRSLDFFRTCGKFSIATMNRGGEKEYFLCCGCEEIYIPPTANLTLKGFMVAGSCCMNQDAYCCPAALLYACQSNHGRHVNMFCVYTLYTRFIIVYLPSSCV